MANIITESGMDFIADNSFHIEKSGIYTKLGQGIRSIEFVRVKDEKLLFIEAKTTFPNPNNPSMENLNKFQSEINEICDKFIHSLNLFSSVTVGVAENAFPISFVLPEKTSMKFILVIKNHESKWCRIIKTAITCALPLYLKEIWKPEVFVVNQTVATEQGLTIVN